MYIRAHDERRKEEEGRIPCALALLATYNSVGLLINLNCSKMLSCGTSVAIILFCFPVGQHCSPIILEARTSNSCSRCNMYGY